MSIDKVILMAVTEISKSFNAETQIELKLKLKSLDYDGEFYLRVPVSDIEKYKLGDEYVIRISRI